MQIIAPEKYPAILDYLNNPPAEGEDPPYGDGMDQIFAAKLDDNGDVIAIGGDGGKILAIKIGDTETSIRLANFDDTKDVLAPKEAAKFAKYPEGQEQIIDSIKNAGDREISAWLDNIKDVLLTADDLDTARDAVFQFYPDLDSAKFQSEIENHLTLASLQGYFEAENEQ
jgi:phage gp29-like protein